MWSGGGDEGRGVKPAPKVHYRFDLHSGTGALEVSRPTSHLVIILKYCVFQSTGQ